MTNEKLGAMWERQLAEKLYRDGFWTHVFKGNRNGQPSDIIAVKNGHAYLIDAKVCSVKGFPLSRVESNQYTAMTLWRQRGNHEPMFAILTPGGHAWMVSLGCIETCLDRGRKYMSILDIQHFGVEYDKWRMQCE